MSDATDKYGRLTNGGEITVTLTQDEACAVLKAYDYGTVCLTKEDGAAFGSMLAKLKDQIWA